MPGKLFLLPNLLDEALLAEDFLPASVFQALSQVSVLIAESEKMARRYLRRFISHDAMQKIPIFILNEHTSSSELKTLLEPALKGETVGLISDAGVPCVADPGSNLVWLAHEKGIEVKAFVGPSSILLALQLSGFSGQEFTFHGYLPRKEEELVKTLELLEKKASQKTQIWIEAPYRTDKMLKLLIESLKGDTRLCVAANLTTQMEKCISKKVSSWKSLKVDFGKAPAIFLLSNQKF